MTVDYSSRSYWETRLANEKHSGFEWLVASDSIIPLVSTHVHATATASEAPVRILHFGCGSSSLGSVIQDHLCSRVSVTDADYASAGVATPPSTAPHSTTRSRQFDILSLPDLLAASPADGWDLLIDKSTADAISCGPPLKTTGAELPSEPLEVLCANLSRVTRPGCRWISISYSSTRYDFLAEYEEPRHWRVIDKIAISLHSTTEDGTTGVVYRPEIGVWAWVLGRI